MNCAKCNKDVSNAKNTALCAECKLCYHVTCCRIRSMAKLTSMSSQALSTWKCDDCAQESSSTASLKSDSDDPKILELLHSIQRDISSSQESNKSGFDSINRNLANMELSIDDMKHKLSTMETENAELKVECEKLRVANDSLKNRVSNLEMHVEDIQQYSRNRNIEIKGVPVTKNENVYSILESIAKVTGVAYDRNGISIAHRLPAPREKTYPPSIIAQFVSRSTRAEWIAAAKKKKLQTTDLAPSLRPSPVFVVEHLTPQNKRLLLYAKSCVREDRLAFAWARDGKVFIRKTPNSAAKRVWSPDDVDDAARPGDVGDGGRGGCGAQDNIGADS